MDTTSRPAEILPAHNTVYVNNLNEKIKKEELKKSLYHVFSTHGKILEIHAHKQNKLRGQAWIIYAEQASAEKAVESMANFSFYGKPMRVNFARVKSDLISKADETFVARPKRKVKTESKRKKRVKITKEPAAKKSASSSSSAPADTPSPPHNILFIENLPVQCTSAMLHMLFYQYQGYVEARMVEAKPGIAFVEFSTVPDASRAKEMLHNFQISPNFKMQISFAKQ
jgi:U2 small nuclear ribonucleoprotein B''